MKGGEEVPLPLRAGSHCLLGERGCRNEGGRVLVSVRARGFWGRAGVGALRLRAVHGVLEEEPRAPCLEGGPSGSLTPPGPSRLSAAARRPGFYRREALPKLWRARWDRPHSRLLNHGRIGGRPLFHPSLGGLGITSLLPKGRSETPGVL